MYRPYSSFRASSQQQILLLTLLSAMVVEEGLKASGLATMGQDAAGRRVGDAVPRVFS